MVPSCWGTDFEFNFDGLECVCLKWYISIITETIMHGKMEYKIQKNKQNMTIEKDSN